MPANTIRYESKPAKHFFADHFASTKFHLVRRGLVNVMVKTPVSKEVMPKAKVTRKANNLTASPIKVKKPVVVKDALATEVSLRAHVDQTGLTVAGKSRALAALDRLVGGVIGIPAEFFEGIRRRAELRGSERERFILDQASKASGVLMPGTSRESLFVRRPVAEDIRKQLNREAIWTKAEDALYVQAEALDEDEKKTHEDVVISDDWIDMFGDFAGRASSDRLQHLWGQILAGEIRKPGSFALTTLRVISELDSDIASAFQEVAVNRLHGGFLLKPKLEGDELLKWTFLEEVGLLAEVNGTLKLIQSKSGVVASTKEYSLLSEFDHASVGSLNFPLVKITRVGQQIAAILPADGLISLRAYVGVVDSRVKLTIVKIVNENGNQYQYYPVEVIQSGG